MAKLQSCEVSDEKRTMREPHESGLPGDRLPPVSPDGSDLPAERYETRLLLGQGGMGDVTLAHDRLIGRDVALKRLRRGKSDGTWARERFACEARVQGQLEHPSIVPVYDLGKT